MSETASRSSNRRVVEVVLGFVLTAPALLAGLTGLLLPSIALGAISLQDYSPLRGRGQMVGWENYARMLEDPAFGQAMLFTGLLIGVRVLMVAVLPVLLGVGASAFGRAVRLPVRLLTLIPLALYAPVPAALAWRGVLSPAWGLLRNPPLVDRDLVRSAFLLTDGLATLGIAAGLGVIAYLAALRRPAGSGQRSLAAAFAVWIISILATVALGLQSFTWSFALTRGGPANQTLTLGLYQYERAWMTMRFGYAAALTVPALLIAALLGLISVVLIAALGLRLELVPRAQPAPENGDATFKVIGGLLMGLALLVLLGVLVVNLGVYPLYLAGGPPGGTQGPLDTGLLMRALGLNTVLAGVVGVLRWQLPLAFLAALAIGGLRPLGRYSEWLLMPFAPWLFVGSGSLLLVYYEGLAQASLVDSFLALAGPFTISVPMLVLLTLYFKGRQRPYQEALAAGRPALSAFFSTVFLPSLVPAFLLYLAALLVHSQQILWPLAVAHSPEMQTLPLLLLRLGDTLAVGGLPAGALLLGLLPLGIFFLIAFGLFQVFFLDRLALTREGDAAQDQGEPAAA